MRACGARCNRPANRAMDTRPPSRAASSTRSTPHGIADASILLVERDPPDHVAHRRRRKQQAGNDATEIGLRIAENDSEWCDQSFSCRRIIGSYLPGRDQKKPLANRER